MTNRIIDDDSVISTILWVLILDTGGGEDMQVGVYNTTAPRLCTVWPGQSTQPASAVQSLVHIFSAGWWDGWMDYLQ